METGSSRGAVRVVKRISLIHKCFNAVSEAPVVDKLTR